MKKLTKIVLALLLVCTMAITLMACEPKHVCESVCDECGKCENKNCAEDACKDKCPGHTPPPVDELDLLKGWERNVEDETTYDISETADSTILAYNKAGAGWACVKYNLSRFEPSDLGAMKTLVIKLKLEKTAGNASVLYKFEGSDGLITDGSSPEVRVDNIEEGVVVEMQWDVSYMDLSKAIRLIIFADPNSVTGVGTITLTECKLVKTAVNEEVQIGKPAPVVPVDNNKYQGYGTSFNLNNAEWTISGESATKYSVAPLMEGENVVGHKVSYQENTGWTAQPYILGNTDGAEFNTLTLQVKAPAGHAGIVKIEGQGVAGEHKWEDNAEGGFALTTGEWETITIKTNAPITGEFKLLYFGNFVDNGAAGTVELKNVELKNVVYPTDDARSVLAGFVNEGSAKRFTITTAQGVVTASYREAGWDTMATLIDLGEGGYSKVEFKVKGVVGHNAIFAFGPNEYKFENANKFTGEEQTFSISVKNMTGLVTLRVFADWDPWADAVAEPSIHILEAKLVKEGEGEEEEDPTFKYAGYGAYILNAATWVIAPECSYTTEAIVDNNNTIGVKVSYPANVGWSAQPYILGNTNGATFNTLTLQVKAPAGHAGIVKIEGQGFAGEHKWEDNAAGGFALATGEWETITIKTNAPVTGEFKVLYFGNFVDNGEAGTVELKDIQLKYVTYPTAENLSVNAGWVNDNSARFAFATADNGTVSVSYSNGGWDNFITYVDLGEGGYSSVNFKVKGIAGQTAIFNVAGTEVKFEGTPLTGEEQTFAVDVSGKTGVIVIRVFLDFEKSTVAENTTIQFISVDLVRAVEDEGVDMDISTGWNGDIDTESDTTKTYALTIEDGKYTISYEKAASGAEWSSMFISIAEYKNYPSMQIVVKGTEGKTAMFKVEGAGGYIEKNVTFTGASQTIEIAIEGRTTLVIFAEPNSNGGSGSFVIESIKAMGEETEEVLEDKTLDLSALVAGFEGDCAGEDPNYTLSFADNKLTISYDKTGAEYSAIWNRVIENLGKYKYVVITYTSAAGDHIWKLEGTGQAKEEKVTSTGSQQVVILDNSAGHVTFTIMAEGGTATASGSIVISSIVLTNTNPAE